MKKTCKEQTMTVVGEENTKKKKSISFMTEVSLLLFISIMGIWLVSMAILTVVTAQEIYDRLYEKSQNFADSVDDFVSYAAQSGRDDFFEYQMLRSIGTSTSIQESSGGYYDSYNHSTDKERHKLIRDINFPMETAVLFYDAEGNLLYGSESDMMYFNYYTQEEWDEGMDTTVGLHYGWIDIREGKNAENRESDPYDYFRTMYGDKGNLSDVSAIRVTGYFEGTKLVPVVMHYVTETQLQSIAESDDQFSTGSNSYSYITSDVDRTGKLEWQLQFDRSAEHAEEDLVTVYLTYPEMWDYEGKELEYSGKKYNSLAALTESMVSSRKDSDSLDYQDNRYKLNELLVFDKVDGTDIASGDGTTAYYLVTAIRSNPLACSICALRDIYIVTGLLALALLLLTRNAIKKYLIQPTTK